MYEYRLRKFVIKELTPAPWTRVLFSAVRIARKDILFVQHRIPLNNRRGPFFNFNASGAYLRTMIIWKLDATIVWTAVLLFSVLNPQN